MKRLEFTRRGIVATGLAVLLGGCAIIPRGAQVPEPTAPTPEPSATALPQDDMRHRIALLVPTSGENGAVGQSIANATMMAVLDTKARNLRITTYDTSDGAGEAASKAIADGNKLILGPLFSRNVSLVARAARGASVPLISFSNDIRVASASSFVMGHMPEQSIRRSVRYVRGQGARDFAILAPTDEYGRRAEAALRASIADYGGRVVASDSFTRGNTSIISAAERLKEKGAFDTLLIASGARLAALAADRLKREDGGKLQILGTELWSGEGSVTSVDALHGAIFSAVSDARYRQFVNSYEARFGTKPYRIATLGYDAVLLVLRIARKWRPGRAFPVDELRDKGGFLGLDGPFRFQSNGVVERAMEVRQIREGKVVIVDPAATRFSD